MGTAKRERQKANRQAKLEQMARQARVDKSKRLGLRIGLLVAGVVALVGIAVWWGGGKDSSVSSASSTVTLDTTTVDTAVTTTAAQIPAPTPCPAADGSTPRATNFAAAPPMCIDPSKTYTAVVETNKGEFTVTLDASKAPNTVNNFVVLSRYHFYDGLSCHRIISGFMAQCGDPAGDGSGGPGYTTDDELPAAGDYKLGSLAMANAGPNTQGSQFFIITGDQGVQLPPQYTLFGQVSEGFDTTVKAIEAAADPSAANGTPTREPVTITKVTITES